MTIFNGCRSTTFCLGLREKYWREHVRDMLTGIDGHSAPCLILDPLTAQQFLDRGAFDTKAKLIQFIHETAQMPAGRYWDLQLVQNYVYPWATFGREPYATWLKAGEHELINHFPLDEINIVVVGGEVQRLLADHGREVSQDGSDRPLAVSANGWPAAARSPPSARRHCARRAGPPARLGGARRSAAAASAFN